VTPNFYILHCLSYLHSGWTNNNNKNTCLRALCPGIPKWASTRKVKPIWIYWIKRQWLAVASSGPHANMHIAPDSHPTNSIKALKALSTSINWLGVNMGMSPLLCDTIWHVSSHSGETCWCGDKRILSSICQIQIPIHSKTSFTVSEKVHMISESQTGFGFGETRVNPVHLRKCHTISRRLI